MQILERIHKECVEYAAIHGREPKEIFISKELWEQINNEVAKWQHVETKVATNELFGCSVFRVLEPDVLRVL